MHSRRTRAALAIALILSACASRQSPLREKGLEPAQSTADALQGALAPRRLALLVGVNSYHDPAFPELKHAIHDATALGEVFQSGGGGGFDEVEVLTDPSRAEILDGLKRLATSARPDDLVVVYFSGHGTRVPDGETWKRFLLGSDSTPQDLETSAVDLVALQRWFSGLRATRRALIVDACFNGDGKSAVRPADRDKPVVETTLASGGPVQAGEALLFATTPGRPSLEDDALEHGVYTYYLLEALGWGFTEADRDGDSVVTAWEAHDHARGKTLAHTEQQQVPEAAMRVVGMGDVVLAGEPTRRRERDRALVYLYPTAQHALAGATLSVDGRSRGALPGTVPIEPGRHHLALADPNGVVLAEGYAELAEGRVYRADDLARLVDGPRLGVSVRPVVVTSPPFRDAIGWGAAGLELGVWKRAEDSPGRNQTVGVHLGFANSPTRPNFQAPRGLGWLTVEAGWQSDWRRLRGRLTWTVSGVVMPPNYPDGRPDQLDVREVPDQAGWIFGTTGPGLQVGWVFSEVWAAHLQVRPTMTLLDPDHRGTLRAVPWVTSGVGFDAVF